MPRRGDTSCKRKSALWVQDEFKDVVMMLSDHFGIKNMGKVTEAAIYWMIESLSGLDWKIKKDVMERLNEAAEQPTVFAPMEQPEADPSEPIQSPSVPRGGNGTQPSTTPGI